MKKIYNKPTMILVKMETEHFIAGSPGVYDQNQVRTDGSGSTGTHVGGTSSDFICWGIIVALKILISLYYSQRKLLYLQAKT